MDIELKPCPFCGSGAELFRSKNAWFIECKKCNAYMGKRFKSFSSKKGQTSFENPEDCIEAWNKRK